MVVRQMLRNDVDGESGESARIRTGIKNRVHIRDREHVRRDVRAVLQQLLVNTAYGFLNFR